MPDSRDVGTTFSLAEALKALRALREAAGLGPEQFPVEAFVGMISDEVQTLRECGWTDEKITALIQESSGIKIAPKELAENYASPEKRRGGE